MFWTANGPAWEGDFRIWVHNTKARTGNENYFISSGPKPGACLSEFFFFWDCEERRMSRVGKRHTTSATNWRLAVLYARCNHPWLGEPERGFKMALYPAWTTVHLRTCGGWKIFHDASPTTFLCLICFIVCHFLFAGIGVVEYASVQVTLGTGTSSESKSCIL